VRLHYAGFFEALAGRFDHSRASTLLGAVRTWPASSSGHAAFPGVHDVRPPSVALDASTSWSSANCHLPRSFEIEGFTLLFTGAGCPVMVLEAGLAETGPADDLRTLEPLIATPPSELLDYF
jgi:hypothetical protein